MVMVCKTHGEFTQIPHAHFSMKAGCRKCGILVMADKNRYDVSEVINSFKKVHSDRYEYDIKSYNGVANKIKIKSMGSKKPLVPNTSEENRKVNRRVEFVIE